MKIARNHCYRVVSVIAATLGWSVCLPVLVTGQEANLPTEYDQEILDKPNLLVTLQRSRELFLDKNQRHATLDLKKYWSVFPEPGPVVRFHISLPVQDRRRSVFVGWKQDAEGEYRFNSTTREYYHDPVNGNLSPAYPVEMMTYKTVDGERYESIFLVDGSDLLKDERSMDVQLLSTSAPKTVANFLDYVMTGAYEDTIIHANPSVLLPAEGENPLRILQGGSLRLALEQTNILEWIPTADPVELEYLEANQTGTLAMAQVPGDPHSATTGWFFNLADNTEALGPPEGAQSPGGYAVFGRISTLIPGLQILNAINQVQAWNASTLFGTPQNPDLTYQTLPLYLGLVNDKENFVSFDHIHVLPGTNFGFSYSWEWVDFELDTDNATLDPGDRDAFEISLSKEGLLIIDAVDTGEARIKVRAQDSKGRSAEMDFDLVAANSLFMANFTQLFRDPDTGERIYTDPDIFNDGWYYINWLGWIYGDNYPSLTHLEFGEFEAQVVPGDPPTHYWYDYRFNEWLYTSPELFPLFYSYVTNDWLMYLIGTGPDGRWWFDYSDPNPNNGIKEHTGWFLDTERFPDPDSESVVIPELPVPID